MVAAGVVLTARGDWADEDVVPVERGEGVVFCADDQLAAVTMPTGASEPRVESLLVADRCSDGPCRIVLPDSTTEATITGATVAPDAPLGAPLVRDGRVVAIGLGGGAIAKVDGLRETAWYAEALRLDQARAWLREREAGARARHAEALRRSEPLRKAWANAITANGADLIDAIFDLDVEQLAAACRDVARECASERAALRDLAYSRAPALLDRRCQEAVRVAVARGLTVLCVPLVEGAAVRAQADGARGKIAPSVELGALERDKATFLRADRDDALDRVAAKIGFRWDAPGTTRDVDRLRGRLEAWSDDPLRPALDFVVPGGSALWDAYRDVFERLAADGLRNVYLFRADGGGDTRREAKVMEILKGLRED